MFEFGVSNDSGGDLPSESHTRQRSRTPSVYTWAQLPTRYEEQLGCQVVTTDILTFQGCHSSVWHHSSTVEAHPPSIKSQMGSLYNCQPSPDYG